MLAPPRSALASWQAFAATELLDELAVERMLAKLSCRRYRVGLEPVGVEVEGAASGISKSAVSCWLVARTEYALAGCSPRTDPAWTWWRCWWLGSGWPSTAVWLPWASPSTGPRFPLALAEGATENATVVTEVLVGLRDRGLDVTRPMLVVIDGAKALGRAADANRRALEGCAAAITGLLATAHRVGELGM